MYLNLRETVDTIQKQISRQDLQKAYEYTLRLRSQLIAAIYDSNPVLPSRASACIPSAQKRRVTLIIPEPLPGMKELTAAVEEHWIEMLHQAINRESRTGIPHWEKAYVWIEVTTPRGTNNARVWDTSNRAVNVIINNLKGIFFWDDDFAHLAFGITADWGNVGQTKIHICAFEECFNPDIGDKKQENL